ncbi:HDOD domain-containing protein [Aliiglaciecola lipolytica]|uniref:HDOD domain-containing protein n=1 Tax=Aliiglaciecola lipolytica E3 TaxID=1127673 RepID=K6YGK6_9ALTE|nr:HDOD domain-containing protein [Aliiglaciecola lipolytica]GAC15763.1 hypothetical protein GLIP_3142 [Aliiglaciecola lipolytica E3]
MREKSKLTSAQWVALLAKEELPAITSIAGILDKFSNDDRSSIPSLSKVILHDQALSSSLLKVANSSSRSPIKRVTTVSRAAIFLGIQSVKNICLTAKVLEGLLNSKHLAPAVYERLMKLMANAFFAGLLARMMVPNYDESTQEEVYLAAMMYNIGETSFWSTGNPLTRELIQKIGMPKVAFEQYCVSVAGVKFKELSIGLARTWNLGELLIKSLDQPQSRTKEMNIIRLSNQLSEAIGSPPKNRAKFDNLLKDICTLINVKQSTLKQNIETTRKLAVELLGSYNASVLESYIKPLPQEKDFGAIPNSTELANLSIEQQLIISIRSLNALTKSSRSINEFLSLTLQLLSQIFHFHRCSFWVFNQDRSELECRQSVDSDGQSTRFLYSFAMAETENIMSYVLEQDEAVFVENYQDVKWRNYLTYESEQLIESGVLCLSPVKVNAKVVGVISAQFLDKASYFTENEFIHFELIADHLNLCLSYVSKRMHS